MNGFEQEIDVIRFLLKKINVSVGRFEGKRVKVVSIGEVVVWA